MSLAVVYSRAQSGIQAPLVTVEVHISNGLPSMSIVGLAETAVKESKDRVRGALINSQFEYPAGRITVNLAPADLPKEGGRFDLAIAIGILAASGQLSVNILERYEFVGELALSGALRGIKGVLPVAMQAAGARRELFVASDNEQEAVLARQSCIYSAGHLLEVCAHLNNISRIEPAVCQPGSHAQHYLLDMGDVHGQHHAKRSLEIAAAGGHSVLLMGPPGTGKTMLASRLPTIMPSMTDEEAMESAAIASISDQGFRPSHWRIRPYRAPHHTASGVALVGGGSNPRPGEISLAHNGVLFLDELPEFDRKVLEVLREPLESGQITISRAARQAEFPARFQLVAAMNPCPCGYHGHPSGRCRCTYEQVERYRNRISGPLLDRIDMHVDVPYVPRHIMQSNNTGEEHSSESIRTRVGKARQRQLKRNGICNAQLSNQQLKNACRLDHKDADLLERAIDRFGLSTRASHRILKVARTIADLEGKESIETHHVTEAINYRKLDRAVASAV